MYTITGNGEIVFYVDYENENGMPKGPGEVFSANIYLSPSVLTGVDATRITLAPNTRQAADTAFEMSAQYHTIPAQIPSYEPLVTGLVVRALAASALGATNLVTFSVDTVGRRQFRVQDTDSLFTTNWCDLLVCASTGAVTRVTDTNTVPTRFYRVVSP
jgi:hypothetical protein